MRTAARSWPMSFLAGPGLVVSSWNRFTGSSVRGHGPAGHLKQAAKMEQLQILQLSERWKIPKHRGQAKLAHDSLQSQSSKAAITRAGNSTNTRLHNRACVIIFRILFRFELIFYFLFFL